MPAEAQATALPPLFALLKEEADKKGVMLDLTDAKMVEKINLIARRVSREYEIVLAFRSFLEDPKAPRPFYFPDRFDRYRVRQVPTQPAQEEKKAHPVLDSFEAERASLPEVELSILEQQAAPGDTFQNWLRDRKR